MQEVERTYLMATNSTDFYGKLGFTVLGNQRLMLRFSGGRIAGRGSISDFVNIQTRVLSVIHKMFGTNNKTKASSTVRPPKTRFKFNNQADEEIRTLDPLLGKEMLYH